MAGKRVLLRADLNVPLHDGKVSDATRLERLCPTIHELSDKGAKVIVCSHFGRPKGKRVPEMSLAPVAQALGTVLGPQRAVRRGLHRYSRGASRRGACTMATYWCWRIPVSIPGKRRTIRSFAAQLAQLADLYVNDAFSAAHRAHASTEAVAHLLPAYAGRLMQAELEALEAALGNPQRPVMAIVGGAKVSTKLDLLGNLVSRVDVLVIGGAMANTFLAAEGRNVGASLQEDEMHGTARDILQRAKEASCRVVLPSDAVVAHALAADVPIRTVPVDAVPPDDKILDVGPATVHAIVEALGAVHTLIWNGPLGAFETPPFDRATVAVARDVAAAHPGRRVAECGGRRRYRRGTSRSWA